MLVTTFDQNATNVAPAIPLGILLTNAEGGDATTSEARTDISQRRSRDERRCRNVSRPAHEDHEPTPGSPQTERTRDSVFNRLEQPVADPNLDDDREILTYVLGLTLNVHSKSNKPKTDPMSEQRLRKHS